MRRSLSLFSSVAIAATSLVALSHSPVSASADATVIRSTTLAPSAIANADIMRSVRLTRSNQFFVIGRDTSTNGTNLHVWKINDDLSIDNTFGAKDLGASFASPTASNSSCVTAQNNTYPCSSMSTMTVNETADRFAFVYRRYLNGAGSSSNSNIALETVAVGKLSTGEVLGSITTTSSLNFQSSPVADWSQYGAIELGKNMCENGIGQTYQGVNLQSYYTQLWSLMIRPDGSLLLSASCDYSNLVNNQAYPSSVVEYETPIMAAYKPSGSSLVIDTTFGTNGYLQPIDDPATCKYMTPSYSYNTAITNNASTALFAPFILGTFPKSTTVPQHMVQGGVTSYSGCNYNSNANQNFVSKLVTIQANGVIKNTVSFATGFDYFISRWVIDPQGRWNATVRPMSVAQNQQGPSQAATQFVRLLPDGSFDATNGTNGIKEMASLPSTISVNGTNVSMFYSLSGYVTTATGIIFTGFASSGTPSSCQNQPYPNLTRTYYPYYVSAESGLNTSYGTNGLGGGFQIEDLGSDTCSSGGLARTSLIASSGEFVYFGQVRAVGSQTAGLFKATWPKADGVIGGGDGTGAVGAMGRTDTKVYSRKLPTTTQVDTSLTVLTKKASKSQMLRTRTPKVCVALTQSVVLVNTGTCSVQIVDRATKNVVRSLSTRVRDAESTVGTTVNGQDAVRFNRVSTRLSPSARAQIAELATAAAEAQRVILIGHTALLTENTVSNNRIALQRAARVKAELQKQFKAAGVKVPISIVSVGSQAPISTKKSEARQSTNRRVEVYLVP